MDDAAVHLDACVCPELFRTFDHKSFAVGFQASLVTEPLELDTRHAIMVKTHATPHMMT